MAAHRTPPATPAAAGANTPLRRTLAESRGASAARAPAHKSPLVRTEASPRRAAEAKGTPLKASPLRATPKAAAQRTPLKSPAENGTPRKPATPAKTTPVRAPATKTASPRKAATAASGAADTTPTALANTAGAQTSPDTVPESSDELERITEKLWDTFGENLRYVAAGRDAADFAETFTVLRSLERAGANVTTRRAAADADESIVSSQTTASTASATASGSPSNPLGVTTVVMAHVLLLLLRSPPPHSMKLTDIKTTTGRWWLQVGQKSFRAAAAAPHTRGPASRLGFDTTELEQSGDQLATRAVYGLVAKKLLRIHRAGGAPNIRFA